MQTEPTRICLCLSCPAPAHRLYSEQQASLHNPCHSWTTTLATLTEPITKQQIDPSAPIRLEFSEFPIRQIKQLLSYSVSWPVHITKIYSEVKKNIAQVIDKMKDKTISEFKELAKDAKVGLKAVEKYVESKNRKEKDLKDFWRFVEIRNLSLFQSDKITAFYAHKILPNLEQIKKYVQQVSDNSQSQLESLRKGAYEKTKEFFRNQEVICNVKIQKLVNAFNCEMVKAVYDEKIANYRAQCFICKEQVISIKNENKRLGALENLLSHLETDHMVEVSMNYMNKVLKVPVKERRLDDFIESVYLSKARVVWVIDRENAGFVERTTEMQGEEETWIEVVNANNKNLAKGAFISAASSKKDAADLLINMLIYGLLTETEASVKLVTKDHFGAVLQQINESLFPQRMMCYEPDLLGRQID